MTMLTNKRTLSETFQLIDELYGDRNDKFMFELERLQFLLNAARGFGKLIRRGETDKWELAKACASIFARGRAYVHLFGQIDTVAALSKKFPRDVCAYCGKMPCECNAKRDRNIRLAAVDPKQINYTITEWCLEFDTKYGAGNREHGISKAYGRLIEEIVEFSDVKFIESQELNITRSKIKEKLSLESADIFAWIFAIVAMLGIIPEFVQVIEERYCDVCHRCKQRPCDCGPFNLAQERSYPGPNS